MFHFGFKQWKELILTGIVCAFFCPKQGILLKEAECQVTMKFLGYAQLYCYYCIFLTIKVYWNILL